MFIRKINFALALIVMAGMVFLFIESIGTAEEGRTGTFQSTDQNPASQDQKSKIRIETKLVNVTASVTDKYGRFVTGLTKEDFEVYDDNIRQQIAFFANEDAPISMGIVYDVSGSMHNFSSYTLSLLREFFRNSHTEDEFYIYAFNNHLHLVQDFTSVPEEIMNKTVFIKSKGNTALFDATYKAIEKARDGKHKKKVILIFSDGEENSSRYSKKELYGLIRESDVQIYAMGVVGQYGGGGTLRMLTESTGGLSFFPADLESAELFYTRLALILRRQYVIGYYPNNSSDEARWHDVKLTLSAPPQLGRLNIFYKRGYMMNK